MEERFLIWHVRKGGDGRHSLWGSARPEEINIVRYFVFFLYKLKTIYHLVPISDFQGMILSSISDKPFDRFFLTTRINPDDERPLA